MTLTTLSLRYKLLEHIRSDAALRAALRTEVFFLRALDKRVFVRSNRCEDVVGETLLAEIVIASQRKHKIRSPKEWLIAQVAQVRIYIFEHKCKVPLVPSKDFNA